LGKTYINYDLSKNKEDSGLDVDVLEPSLSQFFDLPGYVDA